ncbi:MAG: hypothetical protein R6X27_11970 [Candidatus Desulfacyla sp.]
MKRKKKIKKRPASLPPLRAEEEGLVAQLIQEIRHSAPSDIVKRVPDPLCAQRLIASLPSEAYVVPLLLALKEGFQERNVNRAIRRAVFKLDKRGVSTDAFHADQAMASPILKPPEKERPLCYVGPVNGAGIRAVAVILHRGGKDFDTGFGIVSDKEGFQEFLFRIASRKDAKELREQFAGEVGPFVETSLAHGATILEAAYQTQLSFKSRVPEDYLELRTRLLNHTALLEHPMIYDLMPESAVSGHVPTDAEMRDLLEDPLMETWLIELDAMRPFMEEMYRVNESPILLTPIQKGARIREIQDKCLAAIFTPEERTRLKDRLEEMAYVFLKIGREETAKVALAAAQTADREVTPLKANPVIEILLQRSLAFYNNAVEEKVRERASGKRDAASPIILP